MERLSYFIEKKNSLMDMARPFVNCIKEHKDVIRDIAVAVGILSVLPILTLTLGLIAHNAPTINAVPKIIFYEAIAMGVGSAAIIANFLYEEYKNISG